jgi:hypothetical protein
MLLLQDRKLKTLICKAMKKIRHSWKDTTTRVFTEKQCIKCSCRKHYDFGYARMMYYWGTKVTYQAPSCIIMNGVPYNKIDG